MRCAERRQAQPVGGGLRGISEKAEMQQARRRRHGVKRACMHLVQHRGVRRQAQVEDTGGGWFAWHGSWCATT